MAFPLPPDLLRKVISLRNTVFFHPSPPSPIGETNFSNIKILEKLFSLIYVYRMGEEIDDDMIEDIADEIEEEKEESDEVIKKRRPRYSKEYIERRRKEGNSPENIERLKRMRDKKIELAKLKRIQKMKEELEKNGIKVDDRKKDEPVKSPEPPKIELPQPVPIIPAPIMPTTAPVVPPKPINTKTIKKKSKPKKKVEYIDDDEDDDEYDEEPIKPMKQPPQRELSEADIQRYLAQKVSRMNIKEMEDRMIKQQYNNEMQRLREEAMYKMIGGHYY